MRVLVLAAVLASSCAPSAPLECEGTVQITRDNRSGLEVCGDPRALVVNRADEVTCGPAFQVRACTDCAPDCGECNADADCGDGNICEGINESCACFTPCARDADCGADEACVCSAVVGNEGDADESVLLQHPTCVPASCKTNDDCASGACGLAFTEGCPRARARVPRRCA
jgi:hypothetical protein